MRAYLDTSVINVYLFGVHSSVEAVRYAATRKLFEALNAKKFHAVVSLYSIQEVHTFCKTIFQDDAGHISRIALESLFGNEIELAGLLTREERLRHRTRFPLHDSSDQPHAISAYLNKCDTIITYDRHFQKIKSTLAVYTPDQIIS